MQIRLDWGPQKRAFSPEKPERITLVLQKALAAAPDRLELRLELARMLHLLDRHTEVVLLLAPFAMSEDAAPDLLFQFGRACARKKDSAGAITALRRAVRAGVADAHGELAMVLSSEGEERQALEICMQAFNECPADSTTISIAAQILLKRGEPEKLYHLCASLWQRGNRRSDIIAIQAVAAAAAGLYSSVTKLVDRDRWFMLRKSALEETFNRSLAAEIMEHAMAVEAKRSYYATRGDAIRLPELPLFGGPFIQKLLGVIREEVSIYVNSRLDRAGHPAMTGRPARVDLEAWALTLRGDGHEDWHIHPAGWLSGVYYVAVPQQAPPGAGSIGFGPHPIAKLAQDIVFPRWELQPVAGDLLLFPSYFAHRTWPTGTTEPRICVAFDVVAGDALSSRYR